VADPDVQTDGLQVEPRYQEPDEDRVVGYRGDVTATVTLDDVTTVGRVIDAATGAGANRVEGVIWTLRDPGAAMRDALARAAADGRARAAALAQGAGVAVGAVREIRVEDAPVPPVVESGAVRAAPSPAASTPVSPGELDADASVEMTFALS
jgi:uncharacterized protein YggE